MAGTHKYVKRTGSPGNYKYWYRMPDGSLKASDDAGSPKDHNKAKREHLRRLVQGKKAGHHRMSKQEMMSHTGVTPEELESSGNKNLIANAGRRGHQWEPHEIATAHKEEGQDKTSSVPDSPTPTGGDVDRHRAKKAKKKSASRTRTAEAEVATVRKKKVTKKKASKKKVSKKKTSRRGGTPTPTESGLVEIEPSLLPQRIREAQGVINHLGPSQETSSDRAELRAATKIIDDSPYTMRHGMIYGDPSVSALAERSAASATATEGGGDNIQSMLDELKGDHGIDFGGDEAPVNEVAQASQRRATEAAAQAAQRSNEVASPSGSAAVDMHQADPDLAAADAPLERMEEVEAEGGNPYLSRAKETYERISGDLKPDRRKKVKNFLQAIDNLQENGQPLTSENMLAEYQSVVGDRRTTTIDGVASEFERATFMTLDEVVNNEPINMEAERMKRGFGAMQFARLKPYLNSDFKAANPDAPPPYPTYNDLASWSEFGESQADHISTPGHRTNKAMPQAFYDSMAKGADGKAQMPPGWMPLNLAPAWNYIVKKAQSEGNVPYAFQGGRTFPNQAGSMSAQGKVDFKNQATHREGIIISSIRKYVQMRGGPDQLVDIPSIKMGEMGIRHSDIFKADSDADLKKLITTKIIDPVALQPFLKQEIDGFGHAYKGVGEEIGKSISLVVNDEAPAVAFKKSYTVSLNKSEMIRKIKDLKSKFVVER